MDAFVEELLVVRRRLRIVDGHTEQELHVFSTAKDRDVAISVLEQGKWSVGHSAYNHVPDMKVEGLPGEPEEIMP